jgi:hypothetical protein
MAAVGEIGPKARWGEIIAAQHIAARNAVMECYAQLLLDQARLLRRARQVHRALFYDAQLDIGAMAG